MIIAALKTFLLSTLRSRSLSSLPSFLFFLSTLFLLSYALAGNSKLRTDCTLKIMNVGGA
jgi:hypothetical protein